MKTASATIPANGTATVSMLELLTLAEAARVLRMGQSTLRGLARRRAINHVRLGRRLFFLRVDVVAYVSERFVEAAR